jgi:hypothetical protein
MVDWNPREEMNILSYFWFKLGFWVEVQTLPLWVQIAHTEDTENIRLDAGGVWKYTGDSLKYKIQLHPKGRKVAPEERYYVKLRDD